MTTVSVFEFRNHLAEYLRLVEQGEEVSVTRFAKPVANIVPAKTKRMKSLKDFRGFWGRGGETGEQYLNRVRRSKPGFEM
jgi:prevent-host-death family protein